MAKYVYYFTFEHIIVKLIEALTWKIKSLSLEKKISIRN